MVRALPFQGSVYPNTSLGEGTAAPNNADLGQRGKISVKLPHEEKEKNKDEFQAWSLPSPASAQLFLEGSYANSKASFQIAQAPISEELFP